MLFNCRGADAADTLRLAVQKTGTFAWELEVIKARGLDRQAGHDLEITELASPEATRIALIGGTVDIALGDWIWVSRERHLGRRLVFLPYSSMHGALMVAPRASIRGLPDLVGKELAVAGGPLDKSWLLLQALALRSNLDLASQTKVVYGAPALLYEKASSGEADATLAFWNFCIALEERGFRRLLGMDEVEQQLGARGPVAMIGYVFDESFARKSGAALGRFLAISAEAKTLLATSDEAWALIVPKIGSSDPAELALYRKAYVAGIPRRTIDEEENDARTLYARLVEIGGVDLAGPGKELDPGTYYRGASGEPVPEN